MINLTKSKSIHRIALSKKGGGIVVQTTYRKKNGEIIQRLTNTTDYRIGEFNSYGWEIVNVQYEYKI